MDDVLKAARKGKSETVEEAWMQALEQDEVPWEELIEVGRALCRGGNEETAESLLWFLISTLRESGQEADALKVALEGMQGLPTSDTLRAEAMDMYPNVHQDEWHQSLLDLTLGNEDLDGAEAISRLHALETFSPGHYVRVDPGARIGRIKGLDPDKGLEIQFESREQCFALDKLEELQDVPEDDIRAMVIFEKDRLARLADEDPVELLTLVLNTFGGRMNLKRLRRYVLPALKDTTWGRWWSSVKKRVERAPTVGMTGGSKPDLFVRSEPVTRAEQLRKEFDRTDREDKPSQALHVMKECPSDADGRSDLLHHVAGELTSLIDASDDDAMKLGALAVLRQMAEQYPDLQSDMESIAESVLEQVNVEEAVISRLDNRRITRAVLERLPKWQPDHWPELFVRLIPNMPEAACRRCAERLQAAGHDDRLGEAANAVLRAPSPHAGAVMWLWKSVTGSSRSTVFADVSQLGVLRKLMSTLVSLARPGEMPKKKRKKLLSKARDALLSAGESAIEEAVSEASDDQISALMALVERNQGLTKRVRARAARSIRAARPELFRTSTPPWKQNVIYTTEEGRKARNEQYEYIVNERMPEVIKEIGEAAELGDLSENAEYTAALEERGRLSTQAATIKDELSRARIITEEMAASNRVTIGTRVKVRDIDSGEKRTLTFLGPWDAEPSDGIYSYQAPLSQKFMGKTPGDTVTVQRGGEDRTYEIEEIEPAI